MAFGCIQEFDIEMMSLDVFRHFVDANALSLRFKN